MSACANTRLLARELSKAIVELEQEAENYRDGDKYQPRGETLHRVAKRASAVLAAQTAKARIAELEAECRVRQGCASDLHAIANEAIDCARRWGGKDADYVTAVLLARRQEADARCCEGLAAIAKAGAPP